MKRFQQKGWSRPHSRTRLNQLTNLSKKDAHGTTDRRPDSGRHKSLRQTDNIAVVQELVCSQDDEVMRPVLCIATPVIVHFNHVMCAAEYLI